MDTDRKPHSRAHLAFMAIFGVLGWSVLLAATFSPTFGPDSPARPDLLAFASFLFVAIATRSMAFRLLPETVVSLDAGFYIAAAVCIGSITSGRIVAIALTADATFRLITGVRRPTAPRVGVQSLAYIFYFGGMTGALLMSLSWFFDLDSLYVLAGVGDGVVLGKVMAVGGLFLAAHYTVQGIRMRLLGQSFRRYLFRMAIPGIVAEAAVLPLAALVVFIYHPDQPIRFMLLGATFLVINYAFNRISATSNVLRKRVAELETLSKTSRSLAASLQTHELVRALAKETLVAIPAAETLVLAQLRTGESIRVDYFERKADRFELADGLRDALATQWVLEHGESLYIANWRHPHHDIELQGDIRSWLGVPLSIHGETEGVLIVESREREAFDSDNRALLESIATQAAVALQNAHLYELAMVDGLTRLFVRRYFDARLDEEVERTKRFDTEFSVIMMDLDNFKQLNDTYGHVVGDRALRDIAAVVKEQMRGVDTAARYGGEEFAIVLPRTPMIDAYNLAERIREQIAELLIPTDDGTVSVTTSIGIASFPASGADDAEGLVRLADRALYRAKKTGKNRVELYWSEDDESRRGSLRPA